ncbi:MAG: phosphoribosyltransferase [Verrucomicrobia bacterium]|nr:phosphoribosyltransferase [Verrucomicrobiota bacterium]
MRLFQDRSDAGRQLSQALKEKSIDKGALVVGLARGGVIVAEVIAKELALSLDVMLVRKIGAPGNEELALGAIGEGGEGVFNRELISLLGVTPAALEEEVMRQKEILEKRLALYRGRKKKSDWKGKFVILVDDGIATGSSMQVAIHVLRGFGASKILLAVPVAAPDSLERLRPFVDEVICLFSPEGFHAVGAYYAQFDQVSDQEVISSLGG